MVPNDKRDEIGEHPKLSSTNLVLALDNALSIFDEPVKQALYFHLKQNNVSLSGDNVDTRILEQALRDLMGTGAELLLSRVNKELEKLALA